MMRAGGATAPGRRLLPSRRGPSRRRARALPVLLVLLPLLAGCRTNIFHRGPPAPPPADPEVVRVVNPELERELAVLEASGVFRLTGDPGVATTLRLQPIEWEHGCGMPFLVTMVTLGLVPVVLPLDGEFGFELDRWGATETRAYRITLESRTAIWEIFRAPDPIEEMGKALRAAARERPEEPDGE